MQPTSGTGITSPAADRSPTGAITTLQTARFRALAFPREYSASSTATMRAVGIRESWVKVGYARFPRIERCARDAGADRPARLHKFDAVGVWRRFARRAEPTPDPRGR